MLVIADSSPLHYLVLIQQVDLLPSLYGTVTIPGTVAEELSHVKAPARVRDFISVPPDWLRVLEPQELLAIDDIDEGERAAISLAMELGADLLLIDDLDGRRAAMELGLKITGVVGVLMEASERGLTDLRTSIDALVDTGLYLSKDLLRRLLGDGR